MIKVSFPNIGHTKEQFFKQLSTLYPESDPEIQSCDGVYVYVVWKNITMSITSDDGYSISHREEFRYFNTSRDAIDYIFKHEHEMWFFIQ